MASDRLSPEQHARERSLLFASVADGAMLLFMLLSGLVSGSLTMIAEFVRGTLMLGTEIFSLVVIRRIHRGRLSQLEFGPGKLEQVANLGIAAGMMLGALWIVSGALSLLGGDRVPGSPFSLAATAIVGAANTYLNFVSWLKVRLAATHSPSIIMAAQLRARNVKLFSSCFVLVLMTISAVSADPAIATWADVGGGVFVATFMILNAVEMIRGGLPDLLDRSVNEVVQRSINRALARYFDHYDRLGPVRTRRSGSRVFVEIALAFDARLSIAEVDRRAGELRQTLRHEIDGAEVSILTSAVPAGS